MFEANLLESLRKGVFDNLVVEADVRDEPKTMELVPGGAAINLGSIFGEMLPPKKKRRKIAVKELMKLFLAEESDKLIDNDAVEEEAVRRAENDGIIFIDEIDKIAAKGNTGGADVSREGVQRDILPIVEGSTVMTKYGPVKTDYMLFIAAGAFHVARVEDLIPELQGRFPVSVELTPLTKEDFINILTSTEHSLTRQYAVLLAVDNIDLKFTPDAIEAIAEISEEINMTSEDIGARRLHTVMEYLLEDISFNAGGGDYPLVTVEIDRKYVEEHLAKITKNRDLKKYVLRKKGGEYDEGTVQRAGSPRQIGRPRRRVRLGRCLSARRRGEGRPEARRFLVEEVGGRGYGLAEYNLAIAYQRGWGQSRTKSAPWSSIRAPQRSTSGRRVQPRFLLSQRDGVERDPKRALYWWNSALAHGFRKAGEAIGQFAARLMQQEEERKEQSKKEQRS